jgi:hypothetical protein
MSKNKSVDSVQRKRRAYLRQLPQGTYQGRIERVVQKRDGTLEIIYTDVRAVRRGG